MYSAFHSVNILRNGGTIIEVRYRHWYITIHQGTDLTEISQVFPLICFFCSRIQSADNTTLHLAYMYFNNDTI